MYVCCFGGGYSYPLCIEILRMDSICILITFTALSALNGRRHAFIVAKGDVLWIIPGFQTEGYIYSRLDEAHRGAALRDVHLLIGEETDTEGALLVAFTSLLA